MKYIEDVDTGELIPIPDNSEEEAINNIPRLVKDDFPEIRINSDGANEIISDLCDQLKEEKANKTVYHKFPFVKIIVSALVVSALAVSVFAGIRYVQNIDFEPVTVQTSVVSEVFEETEEDETDENPVDVFVSKLPAIFSVVIVIFGLRLGIKFMRDSISN